MTRARKKPDPISKKNCSLYGKEKTSPEFKKINCSQCPDFKECYDIKRHESRIKRDKWLESKKKPTPKESKPAPMITVPGRRKTGPGSKPRKIKCDAYKKEKKSAEFQKEHCAQCLEKKECFAAIEVIEKKKKPIPKEPEASTTIIERPHPEPEPQQEPAATPQEQQEEPKKEPKKEPKTVDEIMEETCQGKGPRLDPRKCRKCLNFNKCQKKDLAYFIPMPCYIFDSMAKDLSRPAQLLFHTINRRVNFKKGKNYNVCRVNYLTLSKLTGLGKTTIGRYVKELETEHYIVWEWTRKGSSDRPKPHTVHKFQVQWRIDAEKLKIKFDKRSLN